MRRIIPIILALGCTPTVYIHTDTPDEQRVTIRDASRKLGVRLKTTDSPQGAVTVEFKGHDEGVCGVALEKLVGTDSPRKVLTEGLIDCQPKAWSCDAPHFLAHEIGHVLGLSHKDGTLMAPAPTPDSELTATQRLVVGAAAVLMAEVCPRDPAAVETDPHDTPEGEE